MSGKDLKGLYKTLGVDTNADETAIRKAYRRLALRCHPDKNQDNENATAEFQKIANAYEVLSDPKRRSLYDSTGCVDAEELDGDGFMRAEDLFAAFFGGGMAQDLDDEEQAMLDEFLKMTGAFSFKGRRRRGKAQAASFEKAFLAAMAGMPTTDPTCPSGHALKRKKADGGYECDICQEDVPDGKRFFDCRKCDFSMCAKCYKHAEAAAMEEAEEEEEEGEIFEAFCSMNIQPERQGGRLAFRCKLCGKLLDTQSKAAEHLVDDHAQEFEMVANEVRSEMGGYAAASSSGMDGFEAFLLGAMEGFGPGPMGDLGGGFGGLGGPPKGRRHRRKR
ncbi:unnamed protein product [Durusdinium trenchii]|uniref:J domain-containing protein n=1 Tax=Durusdinium trenchii TaxID=1381693 RepID=A0ABP0STI8_9DINO